MLDSACRMFSAPSRRMNTLRSAVSWVFGSILSVHWIPIFQVRLWLSLSHRPVLLFCNPLDFVDSESGRVILSSITLHQYCHSTFSLHPVDVADMKNIWWNTLIEKVHLLTNLCLQTHQKPPMSRSPQQIKKLIVPIWVNNNKCNAVFHLRKIWRCVICKRISYLGRIVALKSVYYISTCHWLLWCATGEAANEADFRLAYLRKEPVQPGHRKGTNGRLAATEVF